MKAILALVSLFLTQGFALADAPASAPTPSNNPLLSFLPLVAVFVVFYFFMIRPQQKKQKEFQNTLSQLKVGDKVSTIGGILGLVKSINDEKGIVLLNVGNNLDIEIYKKAISEVIKP